MNLQQITDFINLRIRNKTPKVIKSELADVQQEIVNEIYKTEIFDKNSLALIVDEIDANARNIGYDILFKKIGKTVFFNGVVFKTTFFSSNIFSINIKNPEYFVVEKHSLVDNIYDISICINNRFENGACRVFKPIIGDSETVIVFSFENLNNIESITFNGSYQSRN